MIRASFGKRSFMDHLNWKIFSLVVAALVAIFGIPCSHGYTYEQDVYAINSLFASLGSPALPGWVPEGGDPCMDGWQGVQCVNSNITGIILSGANLGGELGDKLENFSSIIKIDLSNNNIGGNIPYNLPHTIRDFFLSANKLNGTIPDSLSELALLSSLSLNNNLLSGEIPDAFQALTGLTSLDLSFNNLSGQLPPSLGNLSSLTALHMQNNQLSGYLNVLEDLPLDDLNIENNLFWGPVPVQLLNILNFKKDGNPFNTTVLPSPPSPTLIPPTPSEAPNPGVALQNPTPGAAPQDLANGPAALDNPGPKKSIKKNMIKIIAIAAASFLFIGGLLCMCMWLMTCWRRKSGVYKKPLKPKGSDSDSVIQETDEMLKVAIQKEFILKSEEHNINTTEREFFTMPQVVDKMILNHSLPSKTQKPPNPMSSVLCFSVASLQEYTNNFNEENFIGGRTLCKVYCAEHPKGQLLAVKKLHAFPMLQTEESFLDLVSGISKLQHDNIVKLVGYCSEHQQRILVYEYCNNATLDHALHSKDEPNKKLSWHVRLQIALGAARALEYLHEVCQPPVMHCNFTSANILLDGGLRVRVSECGLAPLLSSDSVRRTSMAYSGPEVTEYETFMCQSDTYSFGIVMLELLTGLEAYDKSLPHGEQFLVKWAYSGLHDITTLLRMADPSLAGSCTKKSLSQFADIIFSCIQEEPRFRPPMSEVVQKLQLIQPLKI